MGHCISNLFIRCLNLFSGHHFAKLEAEHGTGR